MYVHSHRNCPCIAMYVHSHRNRPCIPTYVHSQSNRPYTPMYGPSHHNCPSIPMHKHSHLWLPQVHKSPTATQNQCRDVGPPLPMAARVGTAGSPEHRPGIEGEEAIVSMTAVCTNTVLRRSFHRRARVQARPWGPLLRERSMHVWDVGRGRDASHSLALVLRGRKGRIAWRYQTLLQCGQSCREVVHHSEHYCFG